MKKTLVIAMALASSQILANTTTAISHSVGARAGDDFPEPLRESVYLSSNRDNEAEDYASQLAISARDREASVSSDSTLTSDFDGPYTGVVNAECRQEAAWSNTPIKVDCASRWTHTLSRIGSGELSVSLSGQSEASYSDDSRIQHIPASVKVRGAQVRTIRHINGEFLNDISSVSVPTRTGQNSITFSLTGGFSQNGSENSRYFNRHSEYSMRWAFDADSYRFNAEAESDVLSTADLVVDGSDTVYQLEGRKSAKSAFLPVDSSARYELSGRFKSLDDDLSLVYFGIESYDENFELIESYMVNRFGENYVVSSVSADEIVVNQDISDWASGDEQPYKRAIGIYLDGDTSKRPDHYVMFDRENGGYSSVDANTISLSKELPNEVLSAIVPGVTVVMNHRQSSTHIRVLSAEVPQEWTEVAGTLSGTRWLNVHNAFRPETRYVKVYVSGNWQGGTTEALVFDDLTLEKVD